MKAKNSNSILLFLLISVYRNNIISILPGALISGILVFYILSVLFLIPFEIVIPLAVILSVLIIALTKYYSFGYLNRIKVHNPDSPRFTRLGPTSSSEKIKKNRINQKNGEDETLNALFVIVYLVLLAVSSFGLFYSPSLSVSKLLFIPWENLLANPVNLLLLSSAIALCFFLPGYAIVKILSHMKGDHSKYLLPILKQPLPRVLIAYLFSVFITGSTGYIVPSLSEVNLGYVTVFGNTQLFLNIPNLTSIILLVIYGTILVFFAKHQKVKVIPVLMSPGKQYSNFKVVFFSFEDKLRSYFTCDGNRSKAIIFASWFALVIFYTYYLNDGEIITDQWFHHGRALLINSGFFKAVAASGEDAFWNPPFFPSLLAAFFNLSGVPSVNAYVTIDFLNMIPVISFYYFFTGWVIDKRKRASLLATTLFMLGSGFGWIVAIAITAASPPVSTISSLETLDQVSFISYDVGLPNTFVNVNHPDITTPLVIVAIPAGFTLLGLIGNIKKIQEQQRSVTLINRETDISGTVNPLRSKARAVGFVTIVMTITTLLGILAHDEFYLFVIISCIVMILLIRRPIMFPFIYSSIFASFLCAMILIILLDLFISPTEYYMIRVISNYPLISLTFIFVSVSLMLHIVTTSNIMKQRYADKFEGKIRRWSIRNLNTTIQHEIPKIVAFIGFSETRMKNLVRNHPKVLNISKIAFSIIIVSVVSYLYLFTFIVWEQLSESDIRSQVDLQSEYNTPWYFIPMKLGLPGLLGLSFLLSFIFKRFEREVFVFGIIAIIALLAGPYYNEHRFGKYVMAGMASLAALLIYNLISFKAYNPGSSNFVSILSYRFRLRPMVNGVILGLIVTFSGMSVFLYAGYYDFINQIPDWGEGDRRDSPTMLEMNMLNFLRDQMANDPRIYNIAMPESEANPTRPGLINKIYGFTPVPIPKLVQGPLIFNASTLEDFYRLLESTDTKYILLPKKFIVDELGDIQFSPTSFFSNRNDSFILFSLENFPKIYEDINYVVLEVPPLIPPESSTLSSQSQSTHPVVVGSNNSEIALIYQNDTQEWLHPLQDYLQDTNDSSISSLFSYMKELKYKKHYYPLSMLALSKAKYDTFMDGNLSAFSKEYVILPFEPPITAQSTTNDSGYYLEYVRNGGNLIVIDSADDYNIDSGGMFRKLFSNYDKNNGVADPATSPFVITKEYGYGMLTYVNASGYFNRILDSPNNSFLTLAEFPKILGLELEQSITYLEKDTRVTQVEDTSTSNQNNSLVTPTIKLPGSVSERANQQGIEIPLEAALASTHNIIVVVSLAIAAVIVGIKYVVRSNSNKPQRR